MKPVYEGNTATVSAEPSDAGMTLQVTSQGELCATGMAALPTVASAPPAADIFVNVIPPENRPPADEVSLAVGKVFGTRPLAVTAEFAAEYFHNVRETDPRYADENLAHPGPHSTRLQLDAEPQRGSRPMDPCRQRHPKFRRGPRRRRDIGACAVAANYERKGHSFVELDVLVLADGFLQLPALPTRRSTGHGRSRPPERYPVTGSKESIHSCGRGAGDLTGEQREAVRTTGIHPASSARVAGGDPAGVHETTNRRAARRECRC